MRKSKKFTLSEQDQETYKDIKIYHVYKNDKYADMPLLIHCENGKKAIIPTSKVLMRSMAPDYFNIFKKKGGHFEESRHEDGEIYRMTIRPPQITIKMISQQTPGLSSYQNFSSMK